MDKFFIFYAIVLSYFLGFLLISSVRYHHHLIRKKWRISSMMSDLQEGFVYVYKTPFFRYTTVLSLFCCFADAMIKSNLIHHLKYYYHISAEDVSFYFVPIALGSIIGAMLATYIVGKWATIKVLLYTAALNVLSIGLLLFFPQLEMFIILRMLNSILSSIYIVGYYTYRQKVVPDGLMSRTVAVTRMLAWMANPLAGLVGGIILDRTSNFQYLIIISSIAAFLALLFSWRGLMHVYCVAFEKKITIKKGG